MLQVTTACHFFVQFFFLLSESLVSKARDEISNCLDITLFAIAIRKSKPNTFGTWLHLGLSIIADLITVTIVQEE
jgi:hypothetical protein